MYFKEILPLLCFSSTWSFLFVLLNCLSTFKFFEGEVIFDRNRPLFPPDVIFGPNDDEFSLSLQELKV